MTAKEALAGFQELSRHFSKGYKWGDLEPIWPELLLYSHQALVRVVGIIIKNGKWLPDPDYVLKQVQWWHMNMQAKVEADEQLAVGDDPDAEGKEALQLMYEYLAGRINGNDYAGRLYDMSKRWGKADYALQAQEIEGRL